MLNLLQGCFKMEDNYDVLIITGTKKYAESYKKMLACLGIDASIVKRIVANPQIYTCNPNP